MSSKIKRFNLFFNPQR